MESPEFKNLEQFIDRELKKLPSHSAPETLVANVLAALEARKNAPWYKQPWSEWPRLNQNVFLALAILLVGTLCWLAMPFTAQVSLANLVDRLHLFSWVPELGERVVRYGLVLAGAIRFEWMMGGIAALALLYCWCLAAGLALFRMATQKRLSM